MNQITLTCSATVAPQRALCTGAGRRPATAAEVLSRTTGRDVACSADERP